MPREGNIIYENGDYHVTLETTGKSESYIVWKNAGTHSVKVATIGAGLTNAFERAKKTIQDKIDEAKMSEEDLFRSYGPGKYDTYATAHLHELSMDGSDEECGDVSSTGWYGLLRGPFQHPQLKKYAGAIIEENDQGFVNSQLFTSKRALDKKWKAICKDVESSEGGEFDD